MSNILKVLPDSLRRRLDPTLRLMIETGYLNESLQRTTDGQHMLLNVLEEAYKKELVAYLKEKREEAVKAAKESKGC